jgi:O-antigen/teichoic acid export membrane protein
MHFVRETLVDARQVVVTREGVKSLYRVSLYRNAVYLVVNSAVNSLTGVLFWIAAARIYDAGEVGLASAAVSAVGFVVLFASLGLDYGLVRFLPGDGGGANDIINTCLVTAGLAAIALAGVFIAGLNVWSPALLPIRESPLFLASFILLALVFMTSVFVMQVSIARRRSGLALAQGVIFGVSRFVPLFLLASVTTSLGIYISWGLAVAASTLIAAVWFLPRAVKGYRPRLALKKTALAGMLRFSLANYISSITWSIPLVILPLMVVNILGVEQNAYFYIGWSVASIIFMIPAGTAQALFAEGSRDGESLERQVRKSLKISLVLVIPALIVLVALGDKILWLFGREYSQNTTRLVWVIAPSVIPMSVNFIYLSIRRVQKKMKSVVILTAFMAAVTLGLSYILLPVMGILGAGVAWLTGQVGASVLVAADYLWKKGARAGGNA